MKLFGKRIQLGSISEEHALITSINRTLASTQSTTSDQNLICSTQCQNSGSERCSIGQSMNPNERDDSSWCSDLAPSTVTENPETLSNDKGCSAQKLASDETSTNNLEPQNTSNKPQEVLVCPRCSSINTKFCYFNNYNVSQPRHFCKNCQRYWTAGGTMRNMPVGSGRRKHKTSSSSNPPNGPSLNGPVCQEMSIPTHDQVACFGGPYAWNPIPLPIPWQSAPYPFPFYSPSWNLHYLQNHNSPFLGKHCRDGTMVMPSNSSNEEPSKPQASVPKTVRITDDPIEVARSSAWGSLAAKKDDNPKSSNIRVAIFGGFHQYKGADPQRNNNTSGEGFRLVNQANPAAFSRSLSFHEVSQ